MLEKSVFTNKKEIINFVKEKYGINVTNIKIINRGSANIYSLNNDEYILKEFQSKYTKEEIEKEITIINHLKKDDIKVPSYIKTINDTYYSLYKNKVIIIQEFIEGYTLDRNEENYEQTIECAKVYGMIVKSLENLDILLPLNDLSYLFSKEIFEKSIEKHQELLKVINDKDDEETLKIKRDLEEKINMIKNISKENIFIDTKKLTIKNTHGDFNVLQFIYKNNHINSVIDFVSACRMPIVWELIRSYSYIDKNVKNGIFNLDIFTDYIKEFKLEDITWKSLTKEKMRKFLFDNYYINNNFITWNDNDTIFGMHYLQWHLYTDKYFIGTIKNNIDKETIVGCISYFNYHKIYGNVNYISTVEINYFYQGMKLLNELYKNFINELDFDKDIMITNESMIGRKCHVINDLKKALKKVRYNKNVIIDD